MVRTQLYLPTGLNSALKERAKNSNMTFAAYVRMFLEKEVMNSDLNMSAKNSFFELAGSIDTPKSGLTNEEFDQELYQL